MVRSLSICCLSAFLLSIIIFGIVVFYSPFKTIRSGISVSRSRGICRCGCWSSWCWSWCSSFLCASCAWLDSGNRLFNRGGRLFDWSYSLN